MISIQFKYILTICHLSLLSFLVVPDLCGQYSENYTPIEQDGKPPSAFIAVGINPAEILFKITSETKQKEEISFNTISTYNLRQLFLTGNIYYNDECSRYVGGVVDKISKAANIKMPFRVFVSRFHQPNATAWNDGTIIVNIGLLALLENEDQLAFVLAHEMAHVIREHPYQQYVHKQRLRDVQRRAVDNRKSSISYSVKNEYEADRIAIDFLKNSTYNLEEAANVFDILIYKDVNYNDELPVNLSSSRVKLTASNSCKKGDYSTLMEGYNTLEDETSKSLIQRKERFLQYYNRNFTTERKTEKSTSDFRSIKKISQFELVQNTFRSSDYIRSICYALRLLIEHPNNEFLREKLSENLYYVAYYHKEQEIEDVFFDAGRIVDPDLAGVYCLLNQYAVSGMQNIIEGYVSDQYNEYRDNDGILITLAKLTELYKGKSSSIQYYKKYIELFPNGNHWIFANNKLEN